MNRAVVFFPIAATFFLALALFAGDRPSPPTVGPGGPVVLELFTSEGCSSCPPADKFLQKLDQQPFPGTQLIVLSEHVDYWNHIGWKDPYSAAAFSERQSAYRNHLGLESVYTPQMIVDGVHEFLGSSSQDAQHAIAKSAGAAKTPVRISGVTLEGRVLKAHLETGELPRDLHEADVIFVVALNHAESQVAGGENSGRRLTHVAVVRALIKAGSVVPGQSFSKDVTVKLDNSPDPAELRVIAFVQEPGPGKIRGAALEKLSR